MQLDTKRSHGFFRGKWGNSFLLFKRAFDTLLQKSLELYLKYKQKDSVIGKFVKKDSFIGIFYGEGFKETSV